MSKSRKDNPVAKELRLSRKFDQRVVSLKTKYDRKKFNKREMHYASI